MRGKTGRIYRRAPVSHLALRGTEEGEAEGGSSLCDSDLSELWRMQIQHISSQHPTRSSARQASRDLSLGRFSHHAGDKIQRRWMEMLVVQAVFK